jgi:DDE superfamily endonuclease
MAQNGETGSIRAMEIRLLPFAAMFTQPSWLNAVALATGALLCLNRRTVCAALRAVDGAADKGFSRFHRFLSRGAWSGLQGSRILLGLLLKAFVPDDQPVVVGVDDTIERRRGNKIRDKGIYRDPVRSSRGFRQGRRFALAVVPVAGTPWFRQAHLGIAVSDRSVPLGTGRCQAAAAAPDRAGESRLWDAVDRPLVSAPAAGDGGRRRFCQPEGFPDAA